MSKNESLTPLKMLLFCFHATNTIILSYLPIYLRYKGLDGTQIGWVLAVGPFAAIFSQPFWGYMSDKFKTVKWTLIICIIGLLISSSLFFQMNELIAILFMGAVFYFFTTPIGALGDSLAQRRADELHVNFGSIRMWGSIGFAVSSLIVGKVLTSIGVAYMIWPYLLFGTMALIAAFRLTDVKVEADPIQLKDIKQILQNKPFFIFLFIVMFISISHRANDSFIGLYIEQLGGNETIIGLAWFFGVASEAAVFALAPLWFRKFHPLVFIMFAGLLYSVRYFIYAAVNDPVYLVPLQVLHGITFGTFYLAAFQYISRLIPKLLQSTGHLVFYSLFFGVSGIIGSLIGGALIDSYGGGTLYATVGGFALTGSILLAIYHILPYGKAGTARQVKSQRFI
ncbi:MFS transporter [Lentibacillus daqui]|uniref:MFS transporter n=1 Tax=Lentibacillus daqui TaxID=2911514 RepID=UPI0022B207A8|nr:MFS transporter [Lentibacillus daqui]